MRTSKKPLALLVDSSRFFGEFVSAFLMNELGFFVVWVVKILQIDEEGAQCLCRDPSDLSAEFEYQVSWRNGMDVALLGSLTHLPKRGATPDDPSETPGVPVWKVLGPLGKCHVPRILIGPDETEHYLMRRDWGGAEYDTVHNQFHPEQFKDDVRTFLTLLGPL
jgi:hypothetical protein